jgi:peptidoglycan/xylan/chitin deacetylase (PgdA/CDA1 family)
MQLEYFKYWCSCYYYKIFRPPYGKIKSSQAKYIKAKGYKIIMWDVLSADFDQNITKESV